MCAPDTGQAGGVFDDVETSESDIQDDIEFALIQMKAETLTKIDEALSGSKRAPTATASSAVTKSRAAPARAALRGPLQGLRGGA